jgi:hypothetical protein
MLYSYTRLDGILRLRGPLYIQVCTQESVGSVRNIIFQIFKAQFKRHINEKLRSD